MSEEKTERADGGPAFQAEGGSDSGLYPHPGMSLRDWFAGQAAASLVGGLASSGTSTNAEDAATVATASYFLADAMLEARKK